MQAQLTRPNPDEAAPRSACKTDNNDQAVAARKSSVARFGYLSITIIMLAAMHLIDIHKREPWYELAIGLIGIVATLAYVILTISLLLPGRKA